MLNKIIIIFVLITVSTLSVADTIEVNSGHPDQYVVQKGDTLWDIAGRFLTEPWRWPEIWKVNPQIENPHLIYPGDVISLSYEGETPVLTVERPDQETQQITSGTPSQGRNVKLSPSIRSYDKGDAIASIPIDAIRQFLSRPLVVGDKEMNAWPYIVSNYEQHLVAGSGNKVYIRGLSSNQNGNLYSIYRKGPAYKNKSNKILGYEAIYVGEVIIQKPGDPATGIVTQAKREILNGDRLIPQSEKDISSDFIPRSPGSAVTGEIISVVDGLSEIGQYHVVVLDLGEVNGIEVGNVLGVYQKGEVVVDKIVTGDAGSSKDIRETGLVDYLGKPKAGGEKVQLPEEHAGVIMVFRTFSQISYALVMEATNPFHLHDTVKNL